jgi:hypothetical protein
MRRHAQAVIAAAIGFAIVVALVSPLVPSPLSTVRARHVLHPPNLVAHFAAVLFTTAAYDPGLSREVALQRPAHPIACDSDIVDVTTARLC